MDSAVTRRLLTPKANGRRTEATMTAQDPNTRLARKWAMLLLAVIILAALGLRYRGIA
jgi:hypothetical protein